MAHEMYENDSAMFYKKDAWHGIGTTVEDEQHPRQALETAGLDWLVRPSVRIDYTYRDKYNNPTTMTTTDKVANVREDTGEVLGWVGKDYQVVQNSELAELAYSLSGDDTVVESFGSIRNGKRVYCLVKADSFFAGGDMNDQVDQYLLLCNGHDGTLALTGLPTSIRVQCANTLNMALNSGNSKNMFHFSHAGDMMGKLQEARQALAFFRETGQFFKRTVDNLTEVKWNTQDIQKFWLEVYGMLEAPIVTNPTNENEEKNYIKAMHTMTDWAGRFDEEMRDMGVRQPSAWHAANAVTNWIQHRESTRGRKISRESRIDRNLFGKSASDSIKVMKHTLAM